MLFHGIIPLIMPCRRSFPGSCSADNRSSAFALTAAAHDVVFEQEIRLVRRKMATPHGSHQEVQVKTAITEMFGIRHPMIDRIKPSAALTGPRGCRVVTDRIKDGSAAF
jgi:hypothetical protein